MPAAIMVQSWAEIKAWDAMLRPRCPLAGLVVNDDARAVRSDRVGGKIIAVAVEAFIR
jgi:hypothetical protein